MDMPKWPKMPDIIDGLHGICVDGVTFPEKQRAVVLMYYDRARAEAAIARLRAVSTMIQDSHGPDTYPDECLICRVLALIGPLPNE